MEDYKNRTYDKSKANRDSRPKTHSPEAAYHVDTGTHQAQRGNHLHGKNNKGIAPAEVLMVILTAIIAFATVVNVIVFYLESEGTGKQIDKLTGLNQGTVQMRISGYVKRDKETIDYCYKYNPWPSDNRPQGLPRFVPCDFDTSVNVDIEVNAATMTFSGDVSAIKVGNPTPKEPKDG